ncbi:zinc finger protein 91-like [Hylaeus volcanicus]|uniref:zinc finger protein 91-like n=1 Tax=Hylaeus volcanicus TaxID=313075 RepID=UPI0023B86307|nr:zinc finger protein 91-like [Hylaeus volcanicus]XP_053978852.1 zinc finger protein 91-like [Hylaeus volcanicus]
MESDSPQNVEDGIVATVEICRVCLLGNLVMRDLFLESEVASLSAKAMSFANVKMVPGDGLPTRVCCICADKLESAYEFKLQVEQADTVLRERFVAMNMKEELFFNEVEVHLEPGDQGGGIGEMHMEHDYQSTVESLGSMSREEKSLLKDQLSLLEVGKLDERESITREQENGPVMEEAIDRVIASKQGSEDCPSREEENKSIDDTPRDEATSKYTSNTRNCIENIPTIEHDYILHHEYILGDETHQDDREEREVQQQEQIISEESFPREECAEYVNLLVKAADATNQEEEKQATEDEVKVEQDSESQNETRRSKRKLVRRNVESPRDSDEENYFENLNLSSRLKKVQAPDKSDRVFFMCYLCDKEFLSKNVLREHMHSHEEVRRALSLQETPVKPQKTISSSPKSPPSGKRLNKCPHCGKQYIYIISYTKHLKKHEREKDSKDESMPLEISFHEDEHSLDFDDYPDKHHLESECRKRARKSDGVNGAKSEQENDEDVEGLLEEDDNENEEDAKETDGGREKRGARTETFSCDKCSEKFFTRRGLRKHAILHATLKCSVCEEEFDSLEKLRNHRAKHVLEGVLTEQDLEADAEGAENKEADDFEGEDKKKEDGSQTEQENDEVKSLGAESPSKKNARNTETSSGDYRCKVCYQRFAKKDLLQRHVEQHVKSYKCTQCNKIFNNELTLRNHLIASDHKTIIQGQEYDPNKRIKRVAAKAAQKIIDQIKTEDGLEDYDEKETKAINRSVNRAPAHADGNYGRGKRESIPTAKKLVYKKDLECVSCNKKCTSKQSLAKHMEQHVKDEKTAKSEKQRQPTVKKERQRNCVNETTDGNDVKDDDYDSDFESGLDWPMDNHECSKCKKRYSTKKSLLRHQLLHEEPNFECDICSVKFYRKDKLKAHYDKCSEKNPDQVRKCNICGDSFENNEILREHRAKHVTEGILTEEDLRDIEPRPEEKKPGEKIGRKRRTDIVGLECTECNKQYTSRKGLLRHIQVHEGKKYLCDICPKKFYRREHLKIHVAKHNMIKPYKCGRCSKRFIKEEQLTNHLSKHDRTFKKSKETDSSKRFLCEICSKSFTQSTTLIAHLRAHNGIKPYVCEVCSRPFTTNAYLKMHMRTHTQERPYICQYCSRAFARADTLANHLTSHTGEAKYHCKYCPKNFRRLKSLKEHVFIHTGQRPYACPTCDRRFNNNGSRYAHSKRCKQNFVQNQNRGQPLTQVQPSQNQQRVLQQAALGQGQLVKTQNIKTITITRQPEAVSSQQVSQHQEIIMPLIFPLTVTVADISEEVILPEGAKLYTTT